MEYNIYCGILKMFNDFEHKETENITFDYNSNHPSYELLMEKYQLNKIAGSGSDLSKAFNLLSWVSNNISYKGDSGNKYPKQNAYELLNHAYRKGEKFGINCLALSITLSECYQSIGLISKVVSLNPLSPYDSDNHVVVDVYIKELRKWIMVDPTYNAYVSDTDGNLLGLLELREKLANQEEIKFNKEVNCNGDYDVDREKLKTYMAKNLFYFRCCKKQTFGGHEIRDEYIEFAPNGFNVRERMIENNKYWIKRLENPEEFLKRLEEVKNKELRFGSIKDLEERILNHN